jgi:hypothetical protein
MTPGKKLCVICAEEMPEQAKKCNHCESYQRWLSRLWYDLNLSGLLALVPVVTLSVTFLWQQIVLQRSELAFFPSTCDGLVFSVGVQNKGSRPAILGTPTLTAHKNGTPTPEHFEARFTSATEATKPDQDLIIASETARLFTIRPINNIPGEFREKCMLSLEIPYNDFGASESGKSKPLKFGNWPRDSGTYAVRNPGQAGGFCQLSGQNTGY